MLLIYLSMIETEEDKNKFTLLYEKYIKLMFYVANQILKDDYLAEDTVHQTFVKIIEDLDKIAEIDCHKTRSYIVTMVRNCAINLYRERKNHMSVSLDDEIELTNNYSFEVEDMDTLEQTIAKLPIIYKDILILKYVQEFSNAEISKSLGISEANVRKRLERARSKIQQMLEKEEADIAR